MKTMTQHIERSHRVADLAAREKLETLERAVQAMKDAYVTTGEVDAGKIADVSTYLMEAGLQMQEADSRRRAKALVESLE